MRGRLILAGLALALLAALALRGFRSVTDRPAPTTASSVPAADARPVPAPRREAAAAPAPAPPSTSTQAAKLPAPSQAAVVTAPPAPATRLPVEPAPLPVALATAGAVGAAVGLAPAEPEGEFLPLKVWVNGEERGVQLLPARDGQPCLTAASIEALHLPADLLPRGAADQCLPLAGLEPALRSELRVADGELRLQADARQLPAQRRDLGYGRASPPAEFPRSAYLNYGLDISRVDADGAIATRVPLELGLRAGRWLARSTAQLDDGRLSRQYSSLQRDFPERLATLTLGDISGGGGSVSGGASLLGVQWSRNFGYQPLVQRAPGLDYVGVLDTPSTVEVYVDDRKVSSTLLPAGPFSLQNLPVQAGLAGNARIEILDAFGQRRVLTLPYFVGNNLLKAGESQFSYSLGFARSAGGDRYDQQPALLASHRWGVSEQLTLGYQAVAGDRLGLLGGEADYALGRWGQIGAGQFWGGDPDAPGTASRLGYRYARQRFSVDSNYSRQSASFYGAPGQSPTDARWLWAHRIGASAGSVYGALSYARGRDREGHFERYGLNLGSRLGRLGSLAGQLQYDPREREPRLLLTFSSQWRRGPYSQFGYDHNEAGSSLSARLSAPVSGYTGFGYRLEASRYESQGGADASRLGADLDWRRPAFTGLLTRQQDDAQGNSSRAILAGSLLLHEGGLDLGQPVRGSFASVEVEGLPGAEIFADGRRIGRTGVDRGVSVSDLTPYLDHRLTVLLPTDLPIGTDLPETSLPLTLAEGGGQRLVFRPRRLRLYEGQLQREDGTAVEFAPLLLRRGDQAAVSTASGEGGYLYLQDVEPGDYRLEAGGSRPCRVHLQLPDARETYSHLGRLTCRSE